MSSTVDISKYSLEIQHWRGDEMIATVSIPDPKEGKA